MIYERHWKSKSMETLEVKVFMPYRESLVRRSASGYAAFMPCPVEGGESTALSHTRRKNRRLAVSSAATLSTCNGAVTRLMPNSDRRRPNR